MARLLVCLLACFFWVGAAAAQDGSTEAPKLTDEVRQDFQNWLVGVRADARKQGVSEAVIEAALSDIEPVARILERDRNQAEYTITLAKYRERVITAENIRVGLGKGARHQDLMARVSARYGVQARYILAIWGIETRFGAITGTMPVIPAVATLAYDKRRSAYFYEQLMATLKMLHRGYIDLPNLKGSWAGAMGQPQFMPSSYLAYAQDFDGDGRRDIWNDEGDVFASIANYLARHGWDDNQTWGRAVQAPAAVRARVQKSFDRPQSGCRAIKQMSPSEGLNAWSRQGVTNADGGPLPSRNLDAQMILPDGVDGQAYLVYKNYRSILRYNCAHLYGVTVGELSDALWTQ